MLRPPQGSTLFPYTTLFRSKTERSKATEVAARTPTRSSAGNTVLAQRAKATALRRSEEHTSELQSLAYLVCRLLLEKKNATTKHRTAAPCRTCTHKVHRLAT